MMEEESPIIYTHPNAMNTENEEESSILNENENENEKEKEKEKEEKEEKEEDNNSSGSGGTFDCNICLDTASLPVVTPCGHLYCWPCIYRWFNLHPDCPSCPVCKAKTSSESLIPLYGRGTDAKDPRMESIPDSEGEIPSRPRGRRGESVSQSNPNNYSTINPFGFSGMQFHQAPGFSFGFGGPFGFGMTTWGGGRATGGDNATPMSPEERTRHMMGQLVMVLAFFILAMLVFS